MSVLPVTVVIPVLNEELNLPDCLDSLGDVFEKILVVDSGSTDGTREVASEWGAELLEFSWNGCFPKKRNWTLRNYAFSTEWVLFMDADERVTSEFVEELSRVLPGSLHAGFWVYYTNWFMGRALHYGDVMHKLPLFRIGSGEYEKLPDNGWSELDMEVHEHPVLTGSVGQLRARMTHRDLRSIEAYRTKHEAYAQWEAKRYGWLRSRGREGWDGLSLRLRLKYQLLDKRALAVLYFCAAYLFKSGFRDGRAGFVLACCKFRYFQQVRRLIRAARQQGGEEKAFEADLR